MLFALSCCILIIATILPVSDLNTVYLLLHCLQDTNTTLSETQLAAVPHSSVRAVDPVPKLKSLQNRRQFVLCASVSVSLTCALCLRHSCIITLHAKLSVIVIGVCGFVCLCVCLWVCYHNNSKLHASIRTKLGL